MNSPKEIAQNYIKIGIDKTKLSILNMLLLGFLAGLFIGFAAVGCIFGVAYANKIMGAVIFAAGLCMVVIAGSELFTGNCLLIMPALTRDVGPLAILKNWLFVYIGNFIGSLFIAFLAAKSGVFSAENVFNTLSTIATSKVELSFFGAFVKGIFCNILVCIAVWMAFAANNVSGKILAIFFPIFVFVLCGFEHSVANMTFIPCAIFSGIDGVSWSNFLINNLLPVTLGNIVGGCLVGFVYWAVFLSKKK